MSLRNCRKSRFHQIPSPDDMTLLEEVKEIREDIDYLLEEYQRLKKRVYNIETGDV